MLIFSLACNTGPERSTQTWPAFRGKNGSGVQQTDNLPAKWNVDSLQNIRWKTVIPGFGLSSPIVWGDRIVITTSISSDSRSKIEMTDNSTRTAKDSVEFTWKILSLDRSTGKVLWEKVAHTGIPKTDRSVKTGQVNSTPATNGQYIVAIMGSEGLYCYDFEGNLLWKQNLGLLDGAFFRDLSVQWGHASSPLIYDDKVIVQCDRSERSYVAAFKLNDGTQVWKTNRDEPSSWSTPAIYANGTGRSELITNGANFYRGYAPDTGEELWRYSAEVQQMKIATPIVFQDLIYVTGGYFSLPITVIKAGRTGDISPKDTVNNNENIAWQSSKGGKYTNTPVIYEGLLYACTNDGILTCYDALSGEEIYRVRLGGAYSASPVAGDGKVYFTTESGTINVVKAGREYALLSSNDMLEACLATPAIANELIIRTEKHLYSVGLTAGSPGR